jgi:hypothetical protein
VPPERERIGKRELERELRSTQDILLERVFIAQGFREQGKRGS